jgi:hypothetical protein
MDLKLFTLDPTSDLPTPAGLLLLPSACGAATGVYAPVSAVGWRPEAGPVVPGGPRRPAVWVEGLSQRHDVDERPLWAYAVRASRAANVRPPLTLPLSHDWLLPGAALEDNERAALVRSSSLSRTVRTRKISDVGEYDPQRDTDFSVAAYAFAFWRLCRQPISATTRLRSDINDANDTQARARSDGSGPRRSAPVDRVRVIRLRPHAPSSDSAGNGSTRRYHHRWPVRMHKVRQFYPSTGTHKVIWRGPYIKGPDGAPLLIGPKAQAIT